jgi:separase
MARAWKRAERQQTLRPKSLSSEDITADKMAEETSHLNMSTASAGIFTMQSSIVGASAWTLVKPMFRSFVHLSQVYAHHGMFQDTIYYAEQAHKIAVNIDSTNYIAEALVVMGNAWLRAGTVDKASEFLMQAKDLESVYKETQASVILKSHLGSLYNRQGDNAAELQAYQEAELTLNSLIDSTNISDLDRVLDAAAVLQAEMSRLTIDNRTKQTRLPRKTVSRKKAPVKKAGAVLKASVEPVVSASDQCLHLMSLKGTLLRQKARSFIQWQRSEEVSVIMKEAGSCSFGVFDAIDNHLTLAEHLFQQSSALLPADPVYSVLQESTISFPAIVGAKTASTSDRTSGVRCTPPRKNQTSSSRTTSLSRGSSTTWIEPLKQAHEHLLEAYSIASQISSTRVLNQIASFLNTTTILLSTYHGNKLRTTHPGATAGVLELVKALSVQRERDAVSLDANVSTNKEDDLRWPVVTVHDHQKDGNGRLATQQTRFQKEYIDIIPAAWTVVSVTLSETRQELVLTKFEAGHCPFILRVPLGRNNSRDADEEVFGFDQGKAELTDIIDLANASAHGGRDVSGKAAKIAWWAERDELNDRLKELLDNIEKVWLGGFRGIFSQHSRRPELLARFQKSFQNTLDKHLPSRQRTNKRTKAAQRVTLDSRILELFIGLGDPFSEDCDLDEPLTDLLYFVIDILQFHGERNAYDEIDFDSIVLDTLDALRCYHQAVNGASATKDDSHTILILDASLHSFPWESLPCMQGQSISRLPSMGCLRSRILSLAKPVEAAPDGIYIERAHGGYVLNPGQDLSSTQTTFEAPLAQLPGWTEIVAREPGEAELKEMLEMQELYLYFGHGSGAQYIRSKTIKRMRRCATAVLMGCSSAAVVEAGEFSPYGPPLSYLMAGAPAVVGTLWDVTDRDVDRFAKRAFERWGLFGEGEKVVKVVKTPARRRRVEKVVEVEVEEGQERVSLVEAVARGKKACNYQYLTAAAVVVYGVPVYFK